MGVTPTLAPGETTGDTARPKVVLVALGGIRVGRPVVRLQVGRAGRGRGRQGLPVRALAQARGRRVGRPFPGVACRLPLLGATLVAATRPTGGLRRPAVPVTVQIRLPALRAVVTALAKAMA